MDLEYHEKAFEGLNIAAVDESDSENEDEDEAPIPAIGLNIAGQDYNIPLFGCVAIGNQNVAIGNQNVAIGNQNVAIGNYAIVI